MNRRVLSVLALLLLGLMIGLIVSRFFVPDHFGLITMLLIFLGGLVLGALVFSAGIAWGTQRGALLNFANPSTGAPIAPQPLTWQAQIGTRRITVRVDPAWWERVRTQAHGPFWDAHWREIQVPRPSVVLLCVGLAVVAQILIFSDHLLSGLALYGVAGLGLVVWTVVQRVSLFQALDIAQVGRRAEILLLVVILLVAFGARLIQGGNYPVGIDGDELKWSAQPYFDSVVNESAGELSGQQQWTPTSMALDKISFDWFGVDFNSPRLMTELLSFLATVVFYFVARDMFNVPVALVATFAGGHIELHGRWVCDRFHRPPCAGRLRRRDAHLHLFACRSDLWHGTHHVWHG